MYTSQTDNYINTHKTTSKKNITFLFIVFQQIIYLRNFLFLCCVQSFQYYIRVWVQTNPVILICLSFFSIRGHQRGVSACPGHRPAADRLRHPCFSRSIAAGAGGVGICCPWQPAPGADRPASARVSVSILRVASGIGERGMSVGLSVGEWQATLHAFVVKVHGGVGSVSNTIRSVLFPV